MGGMGRKFTGRRLAWSAAAGAVILATTGVAGYAIKNQIAETNACRSVESHISTNGAVIHASKGAPTVAVLGDSYTAGDGLDDRVHGWAHRLGETEGWDAHLAGVSSTGYINGGFCGTHSFPERIAQALAVKPDTLIIQGGLNDWETPGEDVELAAGLLLSRLTDVRRVVLVGPTNAPSRDNLEAVDRALTTAAAKHNREYVSALGWELEFLPDRLHLTPAGHQNFADRVAAAIRTAA